MILYFYVTRQTIIRLDKNVIVSNSHEYIEGDLHFDRDWDDITAKYVVWERIDSTDPAIKIMLSDDGWDREMNLLLNSGIYRMSVHGLNRNDVWITTHPIEVEVLPTGGVDEASQISVSLTDGQQLLLIANEARDTAEAAQNDAQKGAAAAIEAAEKAETAMEAAQQAANSMSFVSFYIDEYGYLIANNSELLGTTSFALTKDGYLEVTI